MPFGNMLLQSPLQPALSEIDDVTYQEWEQQPSTLIHLWPREETNSWENSDSSEFFGDTSAVNKQLVFPFPSCGSVSTEWKSKSVKQWEPNDIMCWIVSVANDSDLHSEDIGISQFNDIDGTTLCNMSEADFMSREPQHGKFLFNALHELKQEQVCRQSRLPPMSSFKHEEIDYSSSLLELNPARTHTIEGPHSSDESEDGIHVSAPSLQGKRRPGRPRMPGRRGKKPEKKTGRLWEFIRDLLLNRDYCPSLICWENYEEGVFRFVRSEKVAQLWGSLKENPKMTYEKLSRAMRYYYKSKVLQPVLGRRLVYKFGPTATGWHTPNPNFRV